MHACNLNSKLLNPGLTSQAMNEQLLTHWRRVCFLRLNELAVGMFESSDWKSVCGGLELVSELVVPCIRRLSASPQDDDSLAVEKVRNCWCNFLASPLDGKETLNCHATFTSDKDCVTKDLYWTRDGSQKFTESAVLNTGVA